MLWVPVSPNVGGSKLTPQQEAEQGALRCIFPQMAAPGRRVPLLRAGGRAEGARPLCNICLMAFFTLCFSVFFATLADPVLLWKTVLHQYEEEKLLL